MQGGRVAFHFDGVNAQFVDDLGTGLDVFGQTPDEQLAMIRVMTSERRLLELFEDDEPLAAGDWVELELDDKQGGPPAWVLGLSNDRFVGPDRGGMPLRRRLFAARKLPDEKRPRPRPLSSGVTI